MPPLSGKTAVLADVHGNSPALRAVLTDVEQAGCQRIIVVGDVVNGIDPAGSLELLAQHPNVTCLKGNAEAYLLTPRLEEFPDRASAEYAPLIGFLGWIAAHLSVTQLAALAAWPDCLVLDGVCFAHDSPLDRLNPTSWYQLGVATEYQELYFHSRGITSKTGGSVLEKLLALMNERQLSQVFVGHSHEPFIREIDGRMICNVGSVGMPLDGNPNPSWVLLEEDADGRRALSLRRVAYEIEQTLRLLEQRPEMFAGGPPGQLRAYMAGLMTGTHWKSHLP